MPKNADASDCSVIHEDLVEEIKRKIPSDGDLFAMERLFWVMGNPTRARILLALSYHELCVGDLCALLGMAKSAVSHQLANLRDENLVSARREGRIVYYAPSDPHIADVLELGLEHARECCSGRSASDGAEGGPEEAPAAAQPAARTGEGEDEE